ncbi:MAG: hypothetical protein PHN31_00950 [Candidatus Gracilibacteria bacterium]|nr:hypothetical protein [Candidatus Gracilibacteria bacterium]
MNNYNNENTQNVFILPGAKYKLDKNDTTEYPISFGINTSLRKDIAEQLLEINDRDPNKQVKTISNAFGAIKTSVKNILIEK